MARKQKTYYDEQGSLIIRPYRMKDLAAIYDVSPRTMRRWIDNKVPELGKKTSLFFSIGQVQGIINAIGVPQKISLTVILPQFKQAV